MGYGRHSRVHTAKILRLSQDLPIVVELVDTREQLERYLRAVEPNIRDGLATIEKAEIHFYRGGE
jgi:PII-like signaling protein